LVDGKYWNQKIETMPTEELRKHQLQKLREKIKYCYENSSFYRKKFDSVGLKPQDIRTLNDLSKIPFTVKTDLRDNYPYGMVAVKPEEIVEIHASSGTTATQLSVLTRKATWTCGRKLWLALSTPLEADAKMSFTSRTGMVYSRVV